MGVHLPALIQWHARAGWNGLCHSGVTACRANRRGVAASNLARDGCEVRSANLGASCAARLPTVRTADRAKGRHIRDRMRRPSVLIHRGVQNRGCVAPSPPRERQLVAWLDARHEGGADARRARRLVHGRACSSRVPPTAPPEPLPPSRSAGTEAVPAWEGRPSADSPCARARS